LAGAVQSNWRELELFVVSSSEFSGNRADDVITAQIASTIASANLFFEPLEIKIALVGIQIFRADADPFAAAIKRLDADQMLRTLRSEWANRTEINRDIVAVFGTGNYRLYKEDAVTISSDAVFGLAYGKTSCLNPEYSVLVASQGSLGARGELSLSATLAHEIGHILGMAHDDNLYNSLPSLMASSFTINPSGFSPRSNEEFAVYAGFGQPGGSCLSTISPPINVSFEGGKVERIKINEGETFARTIRVSGTQSEIQPSELRSGAKFESTTNLFTFAPDFSVSSKKSPLTSVSQKVKVLAADGSTFVKEFIFDVSDGSEL